VYQFVGGQLIDQPETEPQEENVWEKRKYEREGEENQRGKEEGTEKGEIDGKAKGATKLVDGENGKSVTEDNDGFQVFLGRRKKKLDYKTPVKFCPAKSGTTCSNNGWTRFGQAIQLRVAKNWRADASRGRDNKSQRDSRN